MAARYAKIKDGVVVNVIIAEPDFDPGDGTTIVASETAQTGDAYDGHTFTPSKQVTYQTQGLNFLQFMNLFTTAEQAAIIGSANVQVKIFNLMAAGAPAIDLDNQQVIGGVQYLASQNLIASNRVSDILAGKPQA